MHDIINIMLCSLEELNKLRAAHMKEFQARFTREQQVILQEEMRVLTEKGLILLLLRPTAVQILLFAAEFDCVQ